MRNVWLFTPIRRIDAARSANPGRLARSYGQFGTRFGAAPMTQALHHDTLRALGKRRVVIDRGRHRDRKTKTRQAFPGAGRAITTRTATARIAIWRPAAA
jgi:hypothetical protein